MRKLGCCSWGSGEVLRGLSWQLLLDLQSQDHQDWYLWWKSDRNRFIVSIVTVSKTVIIGIIIARKTKAVIVVWKVSCVC